MHAHIFFYCNIHKASYPLRVAIPGGDRHLIHQHSAQIWSRCLGRRQNPGCYLV